MDELRSWLPNTAHTSRPWSNGYMAAIRPVRHLIVYPPLMRQIERDWRPGAGVPAPAHA